MVLQNLYLTNNATQQKVDFDIYVNDRAGHKSNRVTTQAILLRKE
ncbi:MAG: hypothetical protein U5L96_10310 [Owenweeksia sp.]|nr:hypothetical protein [Owenweeksia sp.]